MAARSIVSDALEPDLSDLRGKGARGVLTAALRLFPVYGLVVITLLLILLFSVLLPDTFFTWVNARLILSNQSSVALLALAAMIPMVAGKIDLSIGYGVVLWEVLAISLQTTFHVPWPLATLLLLLGGALLGLANALLVELARIDAFIATLGTGTVIYAVALWHTNGQQVVGEVPASFLRLANGTVAGVPLPALYVLALSVAFWVVLDYLPLGRCLYAVGANPEAARLNGIPNRTYIALAFVTSGVLTAFTGVVLASRLRIGQVGVGLDYLLPALVAAFLGSTTIKPGRVNVWGTIVAVVILSIGISGLQQLGGAFYVEPLFNGLCLLMAIGLAGFAGRRRVALRKKEELVARAPHPPAAGAAAAPDPKPKLSPR